LKCGLVSLGQALFFAVGAYTAAGLNHYIGLPVYLTIPMAALLGGVISTILIFPALRLRGIQAYAGHVQHKQSYNERRRASLACMKEAENVFRQLRRAGFSCDIFTGAGTGTRACPGESASLTRRNFEESVIVAQLHSFLSRSVREVCHNTL
jgi:hypothetical protein